MSLRARRSGTVLVLAGIALAVATLSAEAQVFTITQITNTTGPGGNSNASINAAGTRIAFLSSRDLTPGSPGNPDANGELFLFDTITGRFTQITNTIGGFVFVPSINAAGTRIVFTSNNDLTPGAPGNADHNVEVFLFDITTGHFTQITNTTGGDNGGPKINADGTRIVFPSGRDLTPGSPGNADGNIEIFLFDTTTGHFTQITNTTGGANTTPVINADGTRIAFTSDRDLTPGSPGNADGNNEIFLFDTTTGHFTQITNTTGGSGNQVPAINGAGTRIAFFSTRNLTPGSPGNADGNAEIFLFDTATGHFTQITNTLGGASANPTISADGTRIAFTSNRDLTPGSPGNVDGNVEIFFFDTAAGRFTQITNTTGGGNTDPAINGDGARIAFLSNRDLSPGSPGNADGNIEVFLAIDAQAGSVPTLSESLQLVLVALLLGGGLYALRRRTRPDRRRLA